jgi:hypothetical protein
MSGTPGRYGWMTYQSYAESQVITADVDWNASPWGNAHQLGLSEDINDWVTYSDLPQKLPVFVTVCQ